jgi:hypothetical protein
LFLFCIRSRRSCRVRDVGQVRVSFPSAVPIAFLPLALQLAVGAERESFPGSLGRLALSEPLGQPGQKP